MKRLSVATAGAFFLTLLAVGPARALEIIYGESKPLGNGTVRGWVQVDDSRKPVAVGVSFPESALSGLPKASDDTGTDPLKLVGHHGHDGHAIVGFEYELPLPKEASSTPFTHIGFNWNPHGHTPPGIYDLPHFDIHFYTITPEERYQITAQGEDKAKVYKEPLPGLLPAGFVLAPDSGEPRMGSHWIDPTSPEFNGEKFTKTTIYGSYDGKLAFVELMLTNEFLATQPNISKALAVPTVYAKDGFYPTSYSVKYDPDKREYSIVLDGMTQRAAASETTESVKVSQ